MSRTAPLSVHHVRPGKPSKFFQNRVVESFAAKPSTPMYAPFVPLTSILGLTLLLHDSSLRHLINFGQFGRNKGEKEEGEKLLKGGNFVSGVPGMKVGP